jgi:hypothetical protein
MRVVTADMAAEIAPVETQRLPEVGLGPAKVHLLNGADLTAVLVVDGVERLRHAVEHTFECRDTLDRSQSRPALSRSVRGRRDRLPVELQTHPSRDDAVQRHQRLRAQLGRA